MAKTFSQKCLATAVKYTENANNQFKLSMVEFPCTFNIGTSTYRLDSKMASSTSELTAPYFDDSNCWRLEHELQDASDDEDFEEIVWKENLLTRVLYELGKKQEAIKLNEKILCETNNKNLTALANSAFLNFYQEEIRNVKKVFNILKELQKTDEFKDVKIQAIIEQAYAYRKLGGCSNLLCAIQLLSSISVDVPKNEKVKFMLALCYRRCTSITMYTENTSTFYRKKLAKEAANRLHELGTTAKDKSIKAAAIAELAFLRLHDGVKECRLIDSIDWEDLIGNLSWKQLCLKALKVDEDKSNDRALKMVGQMFKSDVKRRDLAIELLNQSISLNPSSRAYHHLGLIYVKKAADFDREAKDRTMSETTQPQLSPHQHLHYKKIQSLEERLSCILKVVKKRLTPFSDGNPHVENAEKNLRKAVEVSFKVSISAQYDLALFLARQCNYGEANRICGEVIKMFISSQSGFQGRLQFVNIYNLYGMCYVFEAEEEDDEETRKNLLDRSQDLLMVAIRLATEIAASVPDLKRCATDLWQAFNHLQTKFSFKGDPESKKQMFKLCELVADYRWLPELDEMLSIENSEWQDQICLEIYLQKYIQERDFDNADLFLNLIAIRPNSFVLTIHNSEAVKHLRFEQMKRASEKAIAEENVMDPIWRKIMDEVYLKPTHTYRSEHLNTSTNSQDNENNDSTNLLDNQEIRFDVMLVKDNDSVPDVEDGLWSFRASECIKWSIKGKCGLTVEQVHDLRIPGQLILTKDLSNICQSKVVVFFFDGIENVARHQEVDDDETAEAIRRLSLSSPSGTNEPDGASNRTRALVPNSNSQHQLQSERQKSTCSGYFKHLLVCAIDSMLRDGRPRQIIMAVQSDEDKLLIPSEALGIPVVVISNEDISMLARTSSGDLPSQYELIMNIFKQLVSK